MNTFNDTWTGTPPAGTERIAFRRMPGDAEAAAAIAGLHEQTISHRSLDNHAIGDWISFRLRSWKGVGFQSGRVADVNEARGTLLVETEHDIVEVDAREVGKGGEVLPF